MHKPEQRTGDGASTMALKHAQSPKQRVSVVPQEPFKMYVIIYLNIFVWKSLTFSGPDSSIISKYHMIDA